MRGGFWHPTLDVCPCSARQRFCRLVKCNGENRFYALKRLSERHLRLSVVAAVFDSCQVRDAALYHCERHMRRPLSGQQPLYLCFELTSRGCLSRWPSANQEPYCLFPSVQAAAVFLCYCDAGFGRDKSVKVAGLFNQHNGASLWWPLRPRSDRRPLVRYFPSTTNRESCIVAP